MQAIMHVPRKLQEQDRTDAIPPVECTCHLSGARPRVVEPENPARFSAGKSLQSACQIEENFPQRRDRAKWMINNLYSSLFTFLAMKSPQNRCLHERMSFHCSQFVESNDRIFKRILFSKGDWRTGLASCKSD